MATMSNPYEIGPDDGPEPDTDLSQAANEVRLLQQVMQTSLYRLTAIWNEHGSLKLGPMFTTLNGIIEGYAPLSLDTLAEELEIKAAADPEPAAMFDSVYDR